MFGDPLLSARFLHRRMKKPIGTSVGQGRERRIICWWKFLYSYCLGSQLYQEISSNSADAGVWNFGLGPLNYLRELSSIWVGPTGRTPGCKLSESPTTQLADLTWDLVSRPASLLTLSFSQKVPSLCRCPEPGAHTSLEFYREYKPFRL